MFLTNSSVCMCNAMQSACVLHHFEVFLLFFYVLLLIGKIHQGFMSCFNLCVLIYKRECVWGGGGGV